MKLIYARAACSLSVHILLEELRVPYEVRRVSLKDKKILLTYNPRGYVPALVLDDGTLLTEATSILQYLSETHGGQFMPRGEFHRMKTREWLSFLSSELHKGVAPLFHRDGLKDEYLQWLVHRVNSRLSVLDEALEESPYLTGEYSIADMYALAILRVVEHVGISLEEHVILTRYKERLEAQPTIASVLRTEEEAPFTQERGARRPGGESYHEVLSP